MLGVGLGGFMDGFQKAQQFKADQRRADLAEKESSIRMKLAEEQAQRQRVLNQRDDAEYERGIQQRGQVDAVNADAKAEFNRRVSDGTEQPNNFDTFWSKYALPKLQQTYLSQGNMDMADKVKTWGETTDARNGARLFMSSLSKVQVGDYDGAVEDAFAGAKIKGYLDHSYEFTGKDTLVEREGGPTIGYRFMYKGPDGKEAHQDVPIAKLGQFIATIGNPEVAWKSQMDAQTAADKRANELTDYEAKKRIDKRYGVGGDDQKLRAESLDALRKRFDGGLDMATGQARKRFDDLPPEKQAELLAQERALRTGAGQPGLEPDQSARPTLSDRQAVFDNTTGKQVQAEAAPERAAPQRRQTPEETRSENVAYLLKEAEAALADGTPADRIAAGLIQNGIPEAQWPRSLTAALASRKGVVTGLNVK